MVVSWNLIATLFETRLQASSSTGAWVLNSGACHDSYNFDDGMSPDITDLLSHFHFSVDSSGDSVNDMQARISAFSFGFLT
jgi:hypothetical protein